MAAFFAPARQNTESRIWKNWGRFKTGSLWYLNASSRFTLQARYRKHDVGADTYSHADSGAYWETSDEVDQSDLIAWEQICSF